MSELKVIQIPKMTSMLGNVIGVTEYYLKTEADKVIAERKEKYNELAKLYDKAIQACCDADKVIAELKNKLDLYKRGWEENDKVNAYLYAENAELKEERRWRKFSEEKPKDKQWILVFVENPSKYGTYIELRRWDMGCKFDVEDQELYTKWMPLPKAPKEAK